MRTFVCLVLVACSNSPNDPAGGDDAPAPDAAVGGSITPHVGTWFYDEVAPVSSTCPDSVGNGTGSFVIDAASSTSFHVVPGDGTAPFTCTLSGADFTCAERLAAEEDYRPAIDAVLAVRANASGTFASSTKASGRQEATATCTGSGCSTLGATFPCTLTVDFVIRAR